MQIPCMNNFDLRYKEALQYMWDRPEAKLLLEQGIYPHIESPIPTEDPTSPRLFTTLSVWPNSYGRLHSLNLLIEKEEIDPDGNGRKVRTYWQLDRVKALPLIKRRKGRPETILSASGLMNRCKAHLEMILPKAESEKERQQMQETIRLIEDWHNLPM